jgi:hypothetical protein
MEPGERIREIELFSQMGQHVRTIQNVGEPQMDFQTVGIVSGLYYYRVETSRGNYFGKLVINR